MFCPPMGGFRSALLKAKDPGYGILRGRSILIFFRAASRPREMKEDLAIDRWHHSLYESRNH